MFKNPKTKGYSSNDVIAMRFTAVLLRPKEYSGIATMNLNGDYISDAPSGSGGRY